MADAPKKRGTGGKGRSPKAEAKYVPGKPKRTPAPKVNAKPYQLAWLKRLDRKQKAARIKKLYGFPGVKPPKPKSGEKGSSALRPTGDLKARKDPKELQAEHKRAARSHAKGKHQKGGQKYAGEQLGRQQHVSREIRRYKQPDPFAPVKEETPYDGGDPKRGSHKKTTKNTREVVLLRDAKAKVEGKKKATKVLRDSFGKTRASEAGKKALEETRRASARWSGSTAVGLAKKVIPVAGPIGALLYTAGELTDVAKAGGGAPAKPPKNSKRVKYSKDAKKNYVLGQRDHAKRRAHAKKRNPLGKYARD